MASPPPTSSSNKGFRRKGLQNDVPPTFHASRPSTASSSAAAGHQAHHSISDMFGPALDGPPSPERIRALSNRMRQTSTTDKHRSGLTTSSGSSSLLSSTSDVPSWETSLEDLSVSRNSSQRSNLNNMPSRDRPESVQIMGKAIFNRRGKLRREHSDQSFFNNSSYSTDMPTNPTPAMPRDQHFMQNIFTRRRATRSDVQPQQQKKLQISGPYNFQHVTHTKKDSLPDLGRANRGELVSEFSTMRPRTTTDASLTSISSELHFDNFSSEALQRQQDPSAGCDTDNMGDRSAQNQHGRPQSRDKTLPPLPALGRLTRRAPSQDKIRCPPPRPPRSPIDSPQTSPVSPPPRTSSRVSMRYDGFDPLSTTSLERPVTSSGFRQPQPFILPSTEGLPPRRASADSQCFSHAITTPDDAAWPLANTMSSLPEVPEEEENHTFVRQSRASISSSHSSLRGSVSVPLLRQMPMTRAHARPPSNASDTLGRFDLFAAQRALRVGDDDDNDDYDDDQSGDDTARESWEDDIDYCYEHAAEANCDYAWERPSFDMMREFEGEDAKFVEADIAPCSGFDAISTNMLSSGYHDVPALSPASQASAATPQEAMTPNLIVPVASNFSLPRRDSSALLLRADGQAHSRASSFKESQFKESQGFDLSPSLLIPNDYHQQMLQHERDETEGHGIDESFVIHGSSFCDERYLRSGKTVSQARSSASTTNSVLSEHSLASSGHKSANSTSTAFTRWTGSSTSSWQAQMESLQTAVAKASESEHSITPPGNVMVTLPESKEAILPPSKPDSGYEKHSRAHSDANLLFRTSHDTVAPLEPKPAREPLKTRRRARTTSRSHNAPPQFALFPQTNPMVGSRF